MQNFSTFYVLLALEQLVTELKKMARAGSAAHTYYDIFRDAILYRDVLPLYWLHTQKKKTFSI